jgi:hypothetical protein
MLTSDDLQAIKGIVKDEVQVLDKNIQILDTKIEALDKKLDKAQEGISEILTEVISHHDKLAKRVDHIEKHLNLPSPQ